MRDMKQLVSLLTPSPEEGTEGNVKVRKRDSMLNIHMDQKNQTDFIYTLHVPLHYSVK